MTAGAMGVVAVVGVVVVVVLPLASEDAVWAVVELESNRSVVVIDDLRRAVLLVVAGA